MAIDNPTDNLSEVMSRLERVLEKAERLLEAQLPSANGEMLDSAIAFVWRRAGGVGRFHPVRHVDPMRLADLIGIDRQLQTLARNTRQFLRGAPANHVLLWGERGSGKSSAVKAILNEFAGEGLRLVQVHRHDLPDLPEIIDRLWDRPEKYLLFCDDLSFESDDAEYKELKALLEGGIHARPENLLIYATSNRRHLMPEYMADRQPIVNGDEVHPNETAEEKLSLADRFGIRLGFYKITQSVFLEIVRHLVQARGLPIESATLDAQAIRWAMSYSGFSGRSARQFVDDLEGQRALEG
ncbi:MAG: ATP-binding protein [Armatimonadota bacterium]